MTRDGRTIRRWLAAAAVAFGTSGTLAAQPADAIERAKVARQVADQKAADAVTSAVTEADKLAKTNAVKAAERLRQALLNLDLAVEISAAKRKELTETLQTKIALAEGRPVVPAKDSKAVAVKQSARLAFETAAAEAKEVADGLTKAEQHLVRAQDADARRVVEALAQKFPANPALFAARKQEYTRGQIAADRELARQYASAWTETMRNVDRTAIPTTDDIVFPDKKTWDRITEMRRQPAVKLTPKEEAIIKSLDTPVGAIFNNRPFREALQELSNQIGQPIHIEEKSLEDLGLDLTRPVKFSGNVSARTALRAVLQAQGLTFVVKDEMIQVLTLEKAAATLATRSYYLGDLVTGTGPYGNAVTWGPVLSYQQTMENARVVVDTITSSIDPMAWKDKGNGPCTITFNVATMSVIVRASAEVHSSLGNTLGGRK